MIERLSARIGQLWSDASEIWLQGGWAMIAIAVIAFVMFAVGVHIWSRLRATNFQSVDELTWRGWIDHPERRTGPIGAILDHVDGAGSIEATVQRFDQLRTSETVPFDRDLRVMKVCVGAAPLVGLLGTVTGMLATFGALSSGSGGDKTMALVAQGISEALITTETGLVIALPGLFFQYQLARKYESYKAFLAHIETVFTQRLYRARFAADQKGVKRAAAIEIARKLHARLRGAASERNVDQPPMAAVEPDLDFSELMIEQKGDKAPA